MIECSLGGSSRMTFKTGRAVIDISLGLIVFIIHVRLVVIMAIDAGEF